MNNKIKKQVLTVLLAIMGFVAAQAQQISVVSTNGTTHLFSTLQDAIEGASSGSVIYLPGGGFPISDEVKITKKLTIIGIGHNIKGANVDGNTTISGNLWFNQGSSGSGVMGCFITGDINIGDGNAIVNDILIKYCNLNSVYVRNNSCLGTTINQNYIRSEANFSGSNAIVTNNILHSIYDIDNGRIAFNCLTHASYRKVSGNWGTTTLHGCDNTQIINNVVIPDGFLHYCFNCGISGNMTRNDSNGEYNIGDVDWNDVFVKYNNCEISPTSDFHFKDEYKQYESQVGIYAGTGFSDSQLPPTPYIVGKIIPENTDAAGKLNIKVRVKASE